MRRSFQGYGFAALGALLWLSSPAFAQDPAAAHGEARILTRTDQVEDVLLDEEGLWVASTGGLEHYDLTTRARTRHWTTLDGLDSNHVRSLAWEQGALQATTITGRCELGHDGSLTCTPQSPTPAAIRQLSFVDGVRVVERVEVDVSTRVLASYGNGVLLEETSEGGETTRTRLTPEGQICSNHVTDILAFKGRRFYGSFDDGLCFESIEEPGDFAPVPIAARRINDLFVTAGRLYVGSSQGIHFSEDGVRWRRLEGIDVAVTALARDERFLVAASSSALRWVVLRNHRIRSAFWAPGGTGSIQDMVVDEEGTAFLATEDHGVIRIRNARKLSERQIRYFDRAAGAPSSWVLSLSRAADGTVVAGTLRHGAFRIVEDQIETVSLQSSWLLRVQERNSATYYGTQNGAFVCQEEGCSSIGGLPDPRVHEFYQAQNELYVATELGLLIQPSSGSNARAL